MKYTAPVESTVFLLKDVLGFENELTEPILEELGKFCNEIIAPTNQEGDKHGCFYVKRGPGMDRPIVMPPRAFVEPYKKFSEDGWIGLSVPEEYGGQGLPFTLACATNEFVSSSNMAFSLYPGLTRGAIQAILTFGSDNQKKFFIKRMAQGKWTGTMCLTEPHCGTDLGTLRTKAVSLEDEDNGVGEVFKITGQKIFISGGEHDLSDNIVHLVLARIEGDPEGTKGLSMFIVPRDIEVDRNGSVYCEHNNVECGSIEEKMGIHGSSTCVMNFNESIGYLIGERGKGLNAMFVMMNEMRLGCAIHGLSQSELAYQNALSYAKERIQSSKITDPKGEPVAIINHPDVRRMLMDVKCVNEAARLLVLEAAMLVDKGGEEAEDLLGLMTPVLKGVLTDYGVENAIKMQQVWGGHGYVRENGMEQIVRDARIAMIYEGANGIQALDLVGRKLPKNMGRAIRKFLSDTESFLQNILSNANNKPISPNGNVPLPSASEMISGRVLAAFSDLKEATTWLVSNGMADPNNAGSASYDYMKMFGLILLGIAHLKICSTNNCNFDRKLTAMYFCDRVLPETKFLLAKIQSGSGYMMSAEF